LANYQQKKSYQSFIIVASPTFWFSPLKDPQYSCHSHQKDQNPAYWCYQGHNNVMSVLDALTMFTDIWILTQTAWKSQKIYVQSLSSLASRVKVNHVKSGALINLSLITLENIMSNYNLLLDRVFFKRSDWIHIWFHQWASLKVYFIQFS